MARIQWAHLIKTHRRWLVLAAAAAVALALCSRGADRAAPPDQQPGADQEPAPDAGPPPVVWHVFETRVADVTFQVPEGFGPSVQDGKPLADSAAVYFPSRDEPLAGFSFTLCREADASRCLPKQAQLIASAKVTVDGTSRGLQLVSERPDGRGGRVLTWQTLMRLEPNVHVSFGLQYPAGYARAAELEELYREWLTRVEIGHDRP